MSAILAFFVAVRRDYRRWQNARARARRVVYTWPKRDQRDWSDEYMRSLKS